MWGLSKEENHFILYSWTVLHWYFRPRTGIFVSIFSGSKQEKDNWTMNKLYKYYVWGHLKCIVCSWWRIIFISKYCSSIEAGVVCSITKAQWTKPCFDVNDKWLPFGIKHFQRIQVESLMSTHVWCWITVNDNVWMMFNIQSPISCWGVWQCTHVDVNP